MMIFYILHTMMYMQAILDKQIRVQHVITTNPKQAKAIEDPSRSKIVQILYMKSMHAEQIGTALKRTGSKKALTTIRHHIDVLKEAGLIEVVRMEESRGAMTKYYGTSTKLLGYNTPEDFDKKYSAVIKTASKRLEEILESVAPKAGNSSHKKDLAYDQFIQVEILNRALAQTLERADISRLHRKKGKA